ncbi:hypothetical protein [Lacunisphaera limnophila]|nr:hypothetical protein [Lacunisphaera limnophila]
MAPVSATIFLLLGGLCLGLAARERRRLQAQDPLGRTTDSTNRRQLDLVGRMLVLLGGANLIYAFLA